MFGVMLSSPSSMLTCRSGFHGGVDGDSKSSSPSPDGTMDASGELDGSLAMVEGTSDMTAGGVDDVVVEGVVVLKVALDVVVLDALVVEVVVVEVAVVAIGVVSSALDLTASAPVSGSFVEEVELSDRESLPTKGRIWNELRFSSVLATLSPKVVFFLPS